MTEAEIYLEDLKSKFEKIDPNSYYLAYSGGRDSHLLYWFIKNYLHENRIPIVFANTGMDIPVIRDRALANCDIVLKPAMKHREIKEKFGIPLNSKVSDSYLKLYFDAKDKNISNENMSKAIKKYVFRDINLADEDGHISGFAVNKRTCNAVMNGTLHRVSAECCMYLKKIPAYNYIKETGKKQILGIMQTESFLRKHSFKSCFAKNGVFTPIYDLTEDLKQKIEKEFEIDVPWVYNYLDQTGCAGCPYGIRYHRKNDYGTNLVLSSCNKGHREFILDYFKESHEFKGYHFECVDVKKFL